MPSPFFQPFFDQYRNFPFNFTTTALISSLSLGTMDINAHVIHGSDPGAVPGDSTNQPCGCSLHLGRVIVDFGVEIGSTNV